LVSYRKYQRQRRHREKLEVNGNIQTNGWVGKGSTGVRQYFIDTLVNNNTQALLVNGPPGIWYIVDVLVYRTDTDVLLGHIHCYASTINVVPDFVPTTSNTEMWSTAGGDPRIFTDLAGDIHIRNIGTGYQLRIMGTIMAAD